MPRVPRWRQLADAAAYHVLSRGHNREAIFGNWCQFMIFEADLT